MSNMEANELVETIRVLARSPQVVVNVSTAVMREIEALVDDLMDQSIDIVDSEGNHVTTIDGEDAKAVHAEALRLYVVDALEAVTKDGE